VKTISRASCELCTVCQASDLKERDTHDNSEGRKRGDHCVEEIIGERQSDDPVDLDKFGKMCRVSKDGPFNIVQHRQKDPCGAAGAANSSSSGTPVPAEIQSS
jgi:hypothetical protein